MAVLAKDFLSVCEGDYLSDLLEEFERERCRLRSCDMLIIKL